MKTKIKNLEGIETIFLTERSFIDFVNNCYLENEEIDTPLRRLEDYKDCLIYVCLYCTDIEVIYSNIFCESI